MTPDHYAIVYTEDSRRIFVIISGAYGDFVLTKECQGSDCGCVGCVLFEATVGTVDKQHPILEVERAEELGPGLIAYPFSESGDLLIPIFEGEEIISGLLNRDPSIRHEFTPNCFDSPLEQIFYELAFLDLHIYPQHKVGPYRLDFAIPDKRIAIEIDGHDYHKTKYQRTHDAQRDRWLFGQGWNVLRFTGTEIHSDVEKCVSEVCQLAGVEQLTKIGK